MIDEDRGVVEKWLSPKPSKPHEGEATERQRFETSEWFRRLGPLVAGGSRLLTGELGSRKVRKAGDGV